MCLDMFGSVSTFAENLGFVLRGKRECQNRNENESKEGDSKNPYLSVDPAPSQQNDKNVPISQLRSILLDESLSLFQRYRAMFSLRNIGTEEAVLALCEGFRDTSALFRHEVAYVLGQLQHISSIPSLVRVLDELEEHRMVRHEAAEALGAIGGSKAEEVLKKHLNDKEACVRESCIVALDTIDYWNAPNTKDETLTSSTEIENEGKV